MVAAVACRHGVGVQLQPIYKLGGSSDIAQDSPAAYSRAAKPQDNAHVSIGREE